MPSSLAESLSKQLYGHHGYGDANSSNITVVESGPYIDTVRLEQFYILLPSFVYTALLMSIGLPGNFLVVVVYLMKMAKTTSRHFIITLAMCDFINCAFGMPVELSLLANFYNFDYPYLCKASRFVTFFMNNTSSLVLLAIAVDRFRRVCLPLRPNMTVTHSKVFCIVSVIISMICASPALFFYGTTDIFLPGPENHTLLLLHTCYIDATVDTKLLLIFNLYMFIFVASQFLALTLMYAMIGRVVCRSRSHGKKSGFSMAQSTFRTKANSPDKSRRFSTRLLRTLSQHSPNLLRKSKSVPDSNLPDIAEPFAARDRTHSDSSVRRHGGKEIRAGRTTLILFIVTLIYVLSFIPYLTLSTLRFIDQKSKKSMNTTELAIFNLFFRSYLLNSAANPLVYCFLNRQFRQKVKLFLTRLIKCGRT